LVTGLVVVKVLDLWPLEEDIITWVTIAIFGRQPVQFEISSPMERKHNFKEIYALRMSIWQILKC
jgi:hypothetical protein